MTANIPLLTQAKSGERSFPVHLRPAPMGPVLVVERTPANWYLSNLRSRPVDRPLAIDYGDGLYLDNLEELLIEAALYT